MATGSSVEKAWMRSTAIRIGHDARRPGDDFIEAKDGVRDFVVCGARQYVSGVDEKD